MHRIFAVVVFLTGGVAAAVAAADDSVDRYIFNRAPLAEKPFTELPLGAIEPQGWLRDELQRMAAGMSGHLDEWYPEVCGPRNAWLGGDGDCWERGPYWIDGLYPLARLLDDQTLVEKTLPWIEWTLANQRADGYIGPQELQDSDRTQPPPRGAQVYAPDDWWPRMVMLKILQQHYMATGDERVIDCLRRYFRYQLQTLPGAPLQAADGGPGGSWWAAQRGGDNLMVVLWLYNVTGEEWLLELGDILHEQTVPVTDWFLDGERVSRRVDQGETLHCVNLAQMMKTPLVRYQQDQLQKHFAATQRGLSDMRAFHGQPHGLFGGDEILHGHGPDRGSELCSAVEMMFSLETMFEITGKVEFADLLERVAFNALPTQCTDDHHLRQYFQQTNQVTVSLGGRDFVNDGGDRLAYGLISGYPCCTCNLHQGWPKFAQRLWLASHDGGLAAAAYAPSRVTAQVAGDHSVTITETPSYPFDEEIRFVVETDGFVEFPLHLRIPAWCENAQIVVNDEPTPEQPSAGTMHALHRTWSDGDRVVLRLPMRLTTSHWYERSATIERGPLVFALSIAEQWSEQPWPGARPDDSPPRIVRECRPGSPWNYALPEAAVRNPEQHFEVTIAGKIADNPWTRATAPVVLSGAAVRLDAWTMRNGSAAPPPLSPLGIPKEAAREEIELIPYGATTLRITEFPWGPLNN